MLNWLKRLTNPIPKLVQFPDTIAFRRQGAMAGIREAIRSRLAEDDLVILVAHFPSTFFELQDGLKAWGLEYQVPPSPVLSSQLAITLREESWASEDRAPSRLWLVLSEMLEAVPGAPTVDQRCRVSLIVAERHPLESHDHRLVAFASQLSPGTQMGYFVSLEDPAICPFVGDWAEMLLRQWGMKEADLVTSDLLVRRLARARQWVARQVPADDPVDSPREWLERHGPQTRYAKAIESYLLKSQPTSSDAPGEPPR